MREDRFTIRLAGKEDTIPTKSFLVVLRSILAILRDVNTSMTENRRANLTWDFSHIQMNGPARLDIFPEAREGADIGKAVVIACANGLALLETQDGELPRFFHVRTIELAKTMIGVLRNGIRRIEIDTPYTGTMTLTDRLARNAATMTREAYIDYGTFEGVLETLSISQTDRVWINDTIYGTIPCCFDSDMIEPIRALWTDRVSVFGLTTYTRSGAPRSIHIERIERLRRKSELPQWDDLQELKLVRLNMNSAARGTVDAG